MDGKDGAPVGYLIELKCNITEAKEEKTKEFQKKKGKSILNTFGISDFQTRKRRLKNSAAPSLFPASFSCWISDLHALSDV